MSPHRVGFICRFGLKTGIHFAHFGLESDMVFEGTTECMKKSTTAGPGLTRFRRFLKIKERFFPVSEFRPGKHTALVGHLTRCNLVPAVRAYTLVEGNAYVLVNANEIEYDDGMSGDGCYLISIQSRSLNPCCVPLDKGEVDSRNEIQLWDR